MRKVTLQNKIILFFLLSICANLSHSQGTFGPVNAQWHFSIIDNQFWGPSLQEVATRGSDTIIDSRESFKIITQKKYDMGNGKTDAGYDSTLIFYQNNDTVFVYNNIFNRFTPLYVFNVNEGDTVCLPVPPYSNDFRINPYTGDTSFCFVIDSIRFRQYDTSYLKTIYCSSIASFEEDELFGDYPNFNWGFDNGYYSEIVGGQFGFLPFQGVHMIIDFPIELYGPSGSLQCYSDDTRSINMDTIDCDSLRPPRTYPIAVDNVTTSNDLISIYPNPANENLTIEVNNLNQDIDITLYDMQGRSIKRLPVIKGNSAITLNTNDITAGVYWLNIQTGNGHYTKKITIFH